MSRWQVYAGTFTRHFARKSSGCGKAATCGGRPRARRERRPGRRASARPSRTAFATRRGGELAEGLEVFEFDDVTGKLSYRDAFTSDIVNPQYLAGHPRLPVLYASEFSRPGRLSVFAIGPDGALDRRLTVGTGAAPSR